ncbi:MAG: hypothetical protein AAB881_00795 [Patescibacteria group bacterium]
MLKRNLFFLFTITLFAFASLVLDVFNNNPYQSGSAVFINFYISMFLTFGGIAAIGIYYLKIKAKADKLIYSYFWPSVRQGMIFSFALTAMFALRGFRVLDWWIGISVVVVVTLLELFFQTKKKGISKRSKKNE